VTEAAAGARRTESLTLLSVRKQFGSVVAVDDVSLQIAAGEFLTLLGASGSGKTTTLMIIAGFHIPDAGRVELGGVDVTELPPYRRDLGLVYQHYALFPHMTVARNVAFPLEMRRRPKAEIQRRVGAALELVHLGGYEERLPSQLSGGQQQRVALARALVFEPPVLLMDEPLGALDKKLRETMQAEIKAIQRNLGITTVYVTHDQEEALTLSDRIVVLNGGRIEQQGRPDEVYERPRTRFVAEFMGASNFLPVTLCKTGPDAAFARTANGVRIAICDDRGWKPGVAALAVIRPERVRVARASAPGPWSAPGKIVDVTYVGSSLRYRIQLDSSETLTALQPNLGGAAFGPGETIAVWWEPEDTWLIADERASLRADTRSGGDPAATTRW
jgi:spermidine/putrescine ABC transporter ATP-binding subunit